MENNVPMQLFFKDLLGLTSTTEGGWLEMLLVDNPPSTMQLIARSLIHMVERGASR
jgi:hypothetical protein